MRYVFSSFRFYNIILLYLINEIILARKFILIINIDESQ